MRTLYAVVALLALAVAATSALARHHAARADVANAGDVAVASVEKVVADARRGAQRAALNAARRGRSGPRARRAARREQRIARKAAKAAAAAVSRRVAPGTAAMLSRREHDGGAAAAYGGGGGIDCPDGQLAFEEDRRQPMCSQLVEETQRLDAEEPVGEYAQFGFAVATGDNGLLAVGAETDPDEQVNATNKYGRVQVYQRRTDGTGQYELLQVLRIDDADPDKLCDDGDDRLCLDANGNVRGGAGERVQFGASVAFATNVGGTWLGVGIVAHNRDTDTAQGAVAFYHFDAATRTFTLANVLNDPDVFDNKFSNYFGLALALDDTLGLVGAPEVDTPAFDLVGAVYALRFDDALNEWQFFGAVFTPEQAEADLGNADADVESYVFGTSLALNAASGRALVGAPDADDDAGAAFVLQLNADSSGGLKALQRVTAATMAEDAEFGSSVALVGGTAAVGMDTDVVGTVDVLQFDTATGLFAYAETLEHPQPVVVDFDSDGDDDYFGIAVAIAPDELSIVVGAEGYESDASDSIGRAYLFTRDTTDASFGAAAAHFAPSAANAREDDELGTAVAIGADGSDVVIGADTGYSADGSVEEVGGAFVFPL